MTTAPATAVTSRTCAKTADGVIEMLDVEIAEPRDHEVLLQTRMATICGSDVHLVDDFPMPRGADHLALGHEAVATVLAAGRDVRGVAEGDRVVASCAYGCGRCAGCRSGSTILCETYGGRLPGMANMLGGCQGEYFLAPHADVNVAKVPDGLPDEAAILATDILSTGLAAVERGGVRPGDTVVVFAQGPVGLCATAAARALGAGLLIAVERIAERAEMARRLGATVVLDPEHAVEGVMELTGGRGADVAIEALGRQETFAAALQCTRMDGTVSSVGVYATERSLSLPLDARFYQRRIVTSLCPCGKGRLEQLLALLCHGDADLAALFTHRLGLGETVEAYELFKHRRDGAIKIALVPDAA
jgi:alcohol dehydrogenase